MGYGSTVLWKHLNVKTVSLYWILSGDFSQCRLWRSGEIESYFDDENTQSGSRVHH